MADTLQKTLVMVGMMGAGKTAVGRALAAKLSVPFLDSDAEVVAASNMSIAEIFERDGEIFFRAREREVIARLLDGPPAILSTGGGAFMSEQTRALMSQKGVSVWLDAPLEVLWDRVKGKDTRPLLRTADPYGTLKSIYDTRVPIYALADVKVPARAEYSIDDTAEAVITALGRDDKILQRD